MKTPTGQPLHGVLPGPAQLDLMRAAKTPITADDPLARVKAIEQAIKRIKSKYPSHFRKEISINE